MVKRTILSVSLVAALIVILPVGHGGAATNNSASNVESRAGNQSQISNAGPRPGKYTILSYGAVGKPPLVLGAFVLGKGSYEAFLVGGRSTGTGRYEYDTATQTVKWSSGPYAGVWGGAFTVDREGKTHKIRLKSTTIGTNSVQ